MSAHLDTSTQVPALVGTDQLHLATQLGRLDLVSIVLAAIAIILVFGGVFAFYNFRGVAKKAARAEVRAISQEITDSSKTIAEDTAVAFLQNELPNMVSDYRDIAKNTITKENAEASTEQDEENDHA